jgi:hypothetical protein
MSAEVLTVVASVLGSGATAAVVAARAQRKSQFRERMLTVASDFAATTMKVLAALRRFKPTKPGVRRHRNAVLLGDSSCGHRATPICSRASMSCAACAGASACTSPESDGSDLR